MLLRTPMYEPRHSTPFRGRQAALERLLTRAVVQPGLTTLWGPGGVGKTRLAAEAVRGLRRQHLGVGWVPVRDDASADQVIATALTALNVPEGFGRGAPRHHRLIRWLDHQHITVLVLDEAERTLEGVQAAVERLVEDSPSVHLLVTSRVPLERPDEVLEEVTPLEADEAAELFRDASPRGTYLEANDVGQAVAHLQGLPMAIELAAARLEVLPMAALLERLNDPLPLLRDPGQQGRHAALWSSLDASWQVLPPWAQSALSQCAVFGADVALEAIEGIVELPSGPGAPTVLDALHLLQRRCLLRRMNEAIPRFQLAPFVRDFVALARPEGARDAAVRHAAWFGERALAQLYVWHGGGGTGGWLEREEHELVVAVQRGLTGQVTSRSALESCGAPLAFTMVGRHPMDARLELLEQVLETVEGRDGPTEPRAQGKLLQGLSTILSRKGQPDASIAVLNQALECAQQHHIDDLEATLLGNLGNRLYEVGRRKEGLDAYRRSLDIAVRCGDRRCEASARIALTLAGDWEDAWQPDRSQQVLERVVQLTEALDAQTRVYARHWLARLLLCHDQPASAVARVDEALPLCEANFMPIEGSELLLLRGQAQLLLGNHEEAHANLTAAVSGSQDSHSPDVAAVAVAHLSALSWLRGAPEEAFAMLDEAYTWLGDGPDAFDYARAELSTMQLLRFAAQGDAPAVAATRATLLRQIAAAEEPAYPALADLGEILVRLVELRHFVEADRELDPEPTLGRIRHELQAVERRYVALLHVGRHLGVHLEEACRQAARAWVLVPGGFVPPGGQPVDVTRHAAPTRILEVLATARLEQPGRVVDAETLVHAGWPEETLASSTARNRLHVALNTLRKAGLTVLERVEGGYRLAPGEPMRKPPAA